MKAIMFILLCGFLSLQICKAQPISSWREQNRTGVSAETGLLKSWPANGPTLLWSNEDLPKDTPRFHSETIWSIQREPAILTISLLPWT